MKHYLNILRPKDWVKNLFLFAPLFFGGGILEEDKFLAAGLGFILFSLAASATYIFNDLQDLPYDKLHPIKKHRPLPAGEIKINFAVGLCILLAATAILGSIFLHLLFGAIIIVYLVLNITYSLKLKHIAIIDITCIAIGFLLRVIAGGILVDVVLSHWLLIMTFLISIFLGLGKRRDDVLLLNEKGQQMRKSIDGYTLEFINISMTAMAAVLIVCYINYITSPEIAERIASPYFFISVFFVVIALLRYLQITIVEERSGSPTKIVTRDPMILTLIAGWLIHYSMSIYK